MKNPNKIILFGAGASFGSDTEGTPPLGDDLFDALQGFDKNGWGTIPPNIAKIFRSDFELGVQALASLNPNATPKLQKAMAAFLFDFRPRATNTYLKIANKIVKTSWKGSLVTLNYDLLLEICVSAVGKILVTGRQAYNKKEIELCLPHGCCALFTKTVPQRRTELTLDPTGIYRQRVIWALGENMAMDDGALSAPGNNWAVDADGVIFANPSDFHNRIENDFLPPVMSYFEPEKRTTAGISFILGQRARFSELVGNAAVIGIVGVRVRPRDNHIWQPLADSMAKLVYLSGKQGGMEFDSWSRRNRKGRQNVTLGGYFTELFGEFCNELALR